MKDSLRVGRSAARCNTVSLTRLGALAVLLSVPLLAVTSLVPGTVPPASGVLPFQITTTSLPAATVDQPYAVQFTAIGGTTPYDWKKVGSLPTGLKLTSAGYLSGTAPLIAGNYSVTVSVTDAKSGKPPTNTTVQGTFTLTDNTLPGPSGIVCSGLVGSLTTNTVTVKSCTPTGNKLYKTATGAATSLADVGTPGTFTWNGGGTTTVTPSGVTEVTPNACGSKATEYSFTATVTGASQAGYGVPAVGDAVGADACVSSTGAIKLAPGQTITL